MPGVIARRHPQAVEKILDGGHEIAFHGDTHRPMQLLSEEELAEEFSRGTESLRKLTGYGRRASGRRRGEVTEAVFSAASGRGIVTPAPCTTMICPICGEIWWKFP